MVGFLETTFQHASSSPLPPNVSLARGLEILHEFETVIRLSPDCRGCKPIPPPAGKIQQPPVTNPSDTPSGGPPPRSTQFFEVEDDLPFIPKRLWSGGVRYTAEFLPTDEGCDITVYAPGGFTSTNHWRILREASLPGVPPANPITASSTRIGAADGSTELQRPGIERQQTKDLDHVETEEGGWYVEIVSDAKCNRTFAGFVKGFLKNSQAQLQNAFIELLKATPAQQRSRRPTMGRRRSSVF